MMERCDAPGCIRVFGDGIKGKLIQIVQIVALGIVNDEKHITVAEPVVSADICGGCSAIFVGMVDIKRVCHFEITKAIMIAHSRRHGI